MRNPFSWPGRDLSSTSSLVIGVLVASLIVAGLLASEAIVAARDRRAVSEAMLRQYAQLAAWELSRQARRDVEQALQNRLNLYAHPRDGRPSSGCDCAGMGEAEHWFEIGPSGEIIGQADALPDAVRRRIAQASSTERHRSMEGGSVSVLPLDGDPTRMIAIKPEPHLLSGNSQIGMITTIASLAPVVERTYQRTALLPAVLVGERDARMLVDLRVTGPSGADFFASSGTIAGPYVIEGPLLADLDLPLVTHASMTPEFVRTLGPAHGAGPRTTLIVTLLAVNALLVVVGLWQLKRERELARLRADFVAGVSHELRTPLAQIRMFSETLLLDRVRNAFEKRRALEIISQESKRLGQLVENVLHFHRGSRAHHEGEPIDLKAFVHEVVDSFDPLAQSKGAQLSLAFTPDDVIVRGDTAALRQVLLNLLDNAVKFGPAGQTITVRVAGERDSAVLTVEDEGPGVPVTDRQRIFNAFERGRQTNGTGGAGIGLAVVRQIMLAHRGEVSVDNLAGGGACFRVVLPCSGDGDAAATIAVAG